MQSYYDFRVCTIPLVWYFIYHTYGIYYFIALNYNMIQIYHTYHQIQRKEVSISRFMLTLTSYIRFFNSPILPLGACDAFLRSIGAQALRGGLAKN